MPKAEAEKDVTERSQGAAYQDPPGLEERAFEEFGPLMLRAYSAAGGMLLYECEVRSEEVYNHQLANYQDLLNRGFLARVDVLKAGTTDLIALSSPVARMK